MAAAALDVGVLVLEHEDDTACPHCGSTQQPVELSDLSTGVVRTARRCRNCGSTTTGAPREALAAHP